MVFTFFTYPLTDKVFSNIVTAIQTKATDMLEIYDDSSLLQLFRLSL